jgi:ribosomal protein L14
MSCVQTRSKIIIKDNSGILSGRIINSKSKTCLGSFLNISVTKAKSNKLKKKPKFQKILIVQLKKPIMRLDGSSIKFNSNAGVAVSKSKREIMLGFKRVSCSVPFELKFFRTEFKGNANVLKLAKSLV